MKIKEKMKKRATRIGADENTYREVDEV